MQLTGIVLGCAAATPQAQRWLAQVAVDTGDTTLAEALLARTDLDTAADDILSSSTDEGTLRAWLSVPGRHPEALGRLVAGDASASLLIQMVKDRTLSPQMRRACWAGTSDAGADRWNIAMQLLNTCAESDPALFVAVLDSAVAHLIRGEDPEGSQLLFLPLRLGTLLNEMPASVAIVVGRISAEASYIDRHGASAALIPVAADAVGACGHYRMAEQMLSMALPAPAWQAYQTSAEILWQTATQVCPAQPPDPGRPVRLEALARQWRSAHGRRTARIVATAMDTFAHDWHAQSLNTDAETVVTFCEQSSVFFHDDMVALWVRADANQRWRILNLLRRAKSGAEADRFVAAVCTMRPCDVSTLAIVATHPHTYSRLRPTFEPAADGIKLAEALVAVVGGAEAEPPLRSDRKRLHVWVTVCGADAGTLIAGLPLRFFAESPELLPDPIRAEIGRLLLAEDPAVLHLANTLSDSLLAGASQLSLPGLLNTARDIVQPHLQSARQASGSQRDGLA